MFAHQEVNLNQIDKLTQEGSASIADGHPQAAVSLFLEALEKAQLINNKHSVRICSCNLGALYLLLGDTENALRYLEISVPRNGESSELDSFQLNGDVYYNFGLAYLTIKDFEKAINYLKFSIENFDKVDSKGASCAEAHVLLARAYTQLQNYQLGAAEYKKTAAIFKELNEDYKTVKALINQATCLYHALKPESCLTVTKKCLPICKRMQQDSSTGKLYHDLGILFGRTKTSSLSVDYFKLALELLPPSSSTQNAEELKLMKYRASCLQHIGELLDVEQQFQASLKYHKEAIQLHSKLNNHQDMGKCFSNLAYSYVQLHDYLKAERAYHNALQKMEEIGDLHGQWQVYESLADVNFQEQDIERAIVHYKQADSIVQHIKLDPSIHDRILSKLASVLECQVSGAVRATLNRQRRPISVSKTQLHGQSINSTPVHSMFSHNRVAPQASGVSSVSPQIKPSLSSSSKPSAPSTVKRASHRKRLGSRKNRAKGKRRQGEFDVPVSKGVLSYESESELSCAFQALAMEDDADWHHHFSDNAISTNQHRSIKHSLQMRSSSLPDVEVSGSTRSITPGSQVLHSRSDDVESSSLTDITSDESTQQRPWLNGNSGLDAIEGNHQIISERVPVYAQVTKNNVAEAGSHVEEQEKIYETLNSKFDATALLGSSMPVRDPPSPPLQRPPPLPPRSMWQHEHSNSSGSEDGDTDSSEEEDDDDDDDDDNDEPTYKKYQQSLYMKQLSRGQREKELFQLALHKAYAQSSEAVNEVQESQEHPSKNPSSSTTTIRSSGSDASSKSTRSTKSRACYIM